MNIYDLSHAMTSLKPNAVWHMSGDMTVYANLVWEDTEQECPTEQELLNEIETLEIKFNSLEYERDRKKEYPPIVDQLDALYHGGYDGWKASIDVIKSKYPKPVEIN